MDHMDNFSVTFIPIYLDSTNNDPLVRFSDIMSEKAIACIWRIHSELNKRKLTSKNHSVINRVHNGVFCCCFEKGMAIFTIRLNVTTGLTKSPIILTGYFIPNSSLRTAWKVFRREIIMICMEGADPLEEDIVTKNDTEIFEAADRIYAGLSDELKKKADKIVNDMENVSVPCSFAYTDFPLKYMPVLFESSRADSNIELVDGAESNKIIFSHDRVRKNEEEICNLYPYAKDMYLIINNKKTYLNLQKEEYKNTLSKSEYKSSFRELDSNTELQREYLWFYTREADGITFVFLVSGDEYIRHLEAKNTEFCFIPILMKQANHDIDRRRYDLAVASSFQDEGKSKDEKKAKDEGKKSGGLFSGWGHKKK